MDVRELWMSHIKKERAGFDTIYAKDIFSNWETTRQPEARGERCLEDALELRYGQDQTGLAEQFLERSLLVVSRVLAEERFDPGIVVTFGPSKARGKALETRSLTNALLGRGLDKAALCDAAPDFVTWALYERWDDHSEDAYLRAVRLLLIAGDIEKAAELIKIRRKFKWHGEQAEILRRIISCAVFPIHDDALLASFDAIFDPLRPRFPVGKIKAFTHTEMTRIELGAIRDKYFVSPNREIDWDRTIDAISR